MEKFAQEVFNVKRINKTVGDLLGFVSNADEKDGVAYTYLYYDDINRIYENLKNHPDTTLVSLVKKFADVANRYRKKIEKGYERAYEDDLEPDAYTPEPVMEAFDALRDYLDEKSWDDLYVGEQSELPFKEGSKKIVQMVPYEVERDVGEYYFNLLGNVKVDVFNFAVDKILENGVTNDPGEAEKLADELLEKLGI